MNTIPTITAEEQALKLLADEIKDYQDAKALSDSALCRKFSELGSSKTYSRILAGDFKEMDVERQTSAYSSVLADIAAEAEAGDIPEPFYCDFPAAVDVRLAVTDAMRETGTDRLVIVQGPSGSGKTAIGKCLKQRWQKSIVMEADPTWTHSLYTMLADWIEAINPIERPQKPESAEEEDREKSQVPHDINERKNKVMRILKLRKRLLIIEEAQLLGIPGLDFVKAVINQTPSVIVFLALGTLMRKLETRAYEQTRQLTLNRLKERIELSPPDKKWVGEFMKRRGLVFADPKTADTAALALATDAKVYGRWKFVNQVTRRARRDSQGEKMDVEQFIAAQQAVIKTR